MANRYDEKPPRLLHPDPDRKTLDWQRIVLHHACDIVESYDTPVTLRQLFYRLVSLPHGHPAKIANTPSMYNSLSQTSAEWRRRGWMPQLLDADAEVHNHGGWTSPRQALNAARMGYCRDRTEGQPYQVWLVVEKAGMLAQLTDWFGPLGVPIVALGGQASESLITIMREHVESDGRPAVLLYAGDHDPSGWSILHSLVERTGWWSNLWLPEQKIGWWSQRAYVTLEDEDGDLCQVPNYDRLRRFRVALTPEQCETYTLPRNYAKEGDKTLGAFLDNFGDSLTDDEHAAGRGVQIEMDALDPDDLRDLFQAAISRYWDDGAHEAVIERENRDVEAMQRLIDSMEDG